jgi:hypothetical protein
MPKEKGFTKEDARRIQSQADKHPESKGLQELKSVAQSHANKKK